MKPGGRSVTQSHKVHDQDVHAQRMWFGAGNACSVHARKVAHLFFSPNLNHLSRVAAGVAPLKAVVSSHIPTQKQVWSAVEGPETHATLFQLADSSSEARS